MVLLEVMSSLRKSIEESVEACQRFCNVEFEIPKINLEFPELKIHGELSTNAALVFSKKFSLMPIALADIMLKNFNIASLIIFFLFFNGTISNNNKIYILKK